MTNYREILRLKKLGLNNSQIAQSLGCSRTTVIQMLSVAERKDQLSSAGRPVRQKGVGAAVSERQTKAGIQNAGL